MTLRRSLLLSYVVVLFATPPGIAAPAPEVIDPKNPPEGRFADEWAEVYMAGGKIGYMHTTMAREGDLIHTSSTTKMKLGRVDSPVEIQMEQRTTETLLGVPISFGSVTDASVMKTAMNGTIKDGRVSIVTSQYGIEQTQTFDYPSGALMAWGGFRESVLRGFKPGTEYTLDLYTPEFRLDGPVQALTRIGDTEVFEHRGKRMRGPRVTVTIQAPIGSMELVSWVDESGRPLKAVVPAPGLGNLEMIAADQGTALADFVPPEIFMRTVIEADRKLDRKSLKQVKYRIRATGPDVDLSELPTTGMQRITSREDRSVELLITRPSIPPSEPRASARANSQTPTEPRASARANSQTPTEPRASARADVQTPSPLGADDLAEYLDSNLMINTRDPELIALAKKAAGGVTEPFPLADRLRSFVADYVKTKSLNIGFATASEVCRTREGDCSEHGVLLAALGRLNGLPSRVVVGLAYVPTFGGRGDIFGYHLWTQFYIDGRWIDYDSALSEAVCSPTRIAFATSSLKNAGLADLSLPLLSKIGSIDIDILETK